MNRVIKLISALGLFAGIALLVYIAGNIALSGSPLVALVPVSVVLLIIVFYIRYNDKKG